MKAEALRLGFDRAGVAPAERPEHFDAYRRWLEGGAAGEMGYMVRHAELREDPRALLPGSRSIVMVAMNYRPASDGASSARGTEAPDDRARREASRPPHGSASERRILGTAARYARGLDYHDLMRARLARLLEFVRRHLAPAARGRAFVDTAPVLERDFAARAGIGWIGKNTCVLDARLGSYFFIGGLLLDLDLDPDLPQPDRCGTCTRCLDACPTAAFTAPRFLDARRCLSYHTVELRGAIPLEHREAAGDLVLGCDICQEVCPYNRRAPATPEPDLAGDGPGARVDLVEILSLDEEGFRRRFRGTAFARARRRGMARNAAVALGNAGRRSAVPALAHALAADPEALVRAHAAWALGRIGGAEARHALERARDNEPDVEARAEIERALGRLSGSPESSTG